MFALGFRPVSYVGEGGPAVDPLHDSYLVMFTSPKDLARNQVCMCVRERARERGRKRARAHGYIS